MNNLHYAALLTTAISIIHHEAAKHNPRHDFSKLDAALPLLYDVLNYLKRL